MVPLKSDFVSGDVLEARKPGTSVLDTESDVGFQMMRVNSLPSLISKITGHLRERSAEGVEGDGSVSCARTTARR